MESTATGTVTYNGPKESGGEFTQQMSPGNRAELFNFIKALLP